MSNESDGDSVLCQGSSNVVVHKIRSHRTDSDSDETDEAKHTVEKLGAYLDVWQGIDYAEMSLQKGRQFKTNAVVSNKVDDSTKPGPSSMVVKKQRKLKNQKNWFHLFE